MLKSYYLGKVRDTGEGYAHIVIDTKKGFFATVSDWGNYAYLWTHPGAEFRKFLIGLEPDYLLGKLMTGHADRDVYDDQETTRAIFERLRHLARHVGAWSDQKNDRAFYEKERDLYRKHKRDHGFYSVEDFRSWYEATHIDEAYECHSTVPNRQCWQFCTKTWPRFVALLQKELDEERSRPEASDITRG